MEMFFMIFLAIIAILSLFVLKSTFGKLFWFLICGFISLSFYSRIISPIGFIDDSLTEIAQLFGKKYINPLSKTNKKNTVNSVEYENYDTTVDFDNMPISKEASEYIDTDQSIVSLELDESTKMDLKRILSDTNPDPENKIGTNCGESEKKCEWCSSVFYEEGTYVTLRSVVEQMLLAPSLIGIFTLSPGYGNSEIRDALKSFCDLYRNGERYQCKPGDSRFCSEKCQSEYKLYH